MRTILCAIPILLLTSPFNQGRFEYHELDEPALRLGTEESGAILNRPRDFACDDSGNIYVLDSDKHVVVFNSNGEYMSEFGREGSGPGEFRVPTEIEIVDSSVYVLDSQLDQIQEFSLTGEYQQTIRTNHTMSSIAVSSTHIFIASFTTDTLIWKILRTDKYVVEPMLTFEAIKEFVSNYSQELISTAGASKELSYDDGSLILTLGGLGIVAICSENYNGEVVVFEPKSSSLDSFIDKWIDENGDWRKQEFISSIPRLLHIMRPWTNNSLITAAHTSERGLEAESMAILIDRNTGQEIGPRYISRSTHIGSYRLIGENRMAAINSDLSTIDFFEINPK